MNQLNLTKSHVSTFLCKNQHFNLLNDYFFKKNHITRSKNIVQFLFSRASSISTCYSSFLNNKFQLRNLFKNQNIRRISISVTNLNEPSKSSNNKKNEDQNRSLNSIFSHDIDIDGQKIHYESAGYGDHVLLLIPGALGTGKNDFLPQLTGLDGSAFKIIAWDPPGYGQSRPPDRDFEDFYRRDAVMAAKLMNKLNYQSYSVLGWSDGGIVGMILAANNPKVIQKLIIWGSNAYVCEEDRELLRKVRDARTGWSERMRRPLVEIYGEEYFYRLWDRFVSHLLTLSDICKSDLKRIECPVLILHGDEDPMLAQEHPIYLVNNIPNATLYRFPKGKHNIHQRFVDEFNQLCEDFLLTK